MIGGFYSFLISPNVFNQIFGKSVSRNFHRKSSRVTSHSVIFFNEALWPSSKALSGRILTVESCLNIISISLRVQYSC